MRQSGVTAMGIIEKCAVAVDDWISSFVENVSDAASLECCGELRAMRVLNAVNGPENLFYAVKDDALAGFFPRMICRKAAVIARMPIFRGEDQVEMVLQFIGNRNDFVAVRDSQSAAGQKIVLQIDDDQRVH